MDRIISSPNPTETIQSGSPSTAFLVLRSGSMSGTMVTLHSGRRITIGRASTSSLVVPDDVCSRTHCEVYYETGEWKLRDLGSRNGTRVKGQPIDGEFVLTEGRQFQIGNTILLFTFDNHRFSQEDSFVPTSSDTATDIPVPAERGDSAPAIESKPEILHRTATTRYSRGEAESGPSRDRAGQEAQRLVRLGLKMGAATDVRALAEIVLDGLFGVTSADLGAVLTFPNTSPTKSLNPSQLELLAFKSLSPSRPFERTSEYVSKVVIETRAAVVAQDISSSDRFEGSDSLKAMRAESIICAPIRASEELYGLIHLVSTNPDNRLGPDDAEFALAVADQMALALEKLIERNRLAAGLARVENENHVLREKLQIETTLIGESDANRRLRERILRVAPTGATVLIRGESGVGKELVARALHEHSGRNNGPFVTMNCAALSESLLESELFGHEKGAFTGAVGRKVGKFEQAHMGTLFLDEVGEMSPAIQAKFLRVLEGHPFERVGGGIEVRVDVRVVAATNRDLEESVEKGQFRKDLYFRLQVMEIFVEPLRDRRSDIPILSKHFVERAAKKCGIPAPAISQTAMTSLLNYPWPGNVRELQNTLERAVILCTGDTLGPSDIQLSSLGSSELKSSEGSATNTAYRPVTIDVIEQEHILATLEWTKWNKSQAAQILAIERSTLDRKLKKYEVDRPR